MFKSNSSKPQNNLAKHIYHFLKQASIQNSYFTDQLNGFLHEDQQMKFRA